MDPIALSEAMPAGETLTKLEGMGVKNVGALADLFLDSRRMIDSSTRVPGEHAKPDEWDAFYNKLGRPASASDYATPSNPDQGLTAVLNSIKSTAHAKGMPTATWDGIVQQAISANQDYRTRLSGEMAERNKKWAEEARVRHGDKMDEMLARGKNVVRQFSEADPAVAALLQGTGLGDFGPLIEMLSKASEVTSPDNAPPGLGGGDGMPAALEEARKLALEARAIVQSTEFETKDHPKHEIAMNSYYEAIKRITDLGYAGATDPKLAPEFLSPQPAGPQF